MPLEIHKFGGAALKDAQGFRRVAEIIKKFCARTEVIVVVSAIEGMTNALERMARSALSGEIPPTTDFFGSHLRIISDLGLRSQLGTYLGHADTRLRGLLAAVQTLKQLPSATLDEIWSFGECTAAHILATLLDPDSPGYVPAESLIAAEGFGSGRVDHRRTRRWIEKWWQWWHSRRGHIVPVIPGFLARELQSGRVCTLGRNGSDFTASMLGSYIKAALIRLWKCGVDGVYTADPRFVRQAQHLRSVTFEEAAEGSYAGAQVVATDAAVLASRHNLRLWIGNTENPDGPGTFIEPRNDAAHTGGVRMVTHLSACALLNVQGLGMIGVTGTARRVFAAMETAGINVHLISQAGSEHSIAFVVRERDSDRAIRELKREFSRETRERRISKIERLPNVAILSIVGEGMKGTPGIVGKLGTALGKAKVNIRVTAQGPSEHATSLVIDADEVPTALQAVHRAFKLYRLG